jgi:hypothetical protein
VNANYGLLPTTRGCSQDPTVLQMYIANLDYNNNNLGWSTYPWNWNNPMWCGLLPAYLPTLST